VSPAYRTVIIVGSPEAMATARRSGAPGVAAGAGIALAAVVAASLAVGVVAGLVGAGGGFLIVPALALFGGLAMPEAVGTSLLVIALQSFAGFAGHAGHVHLDRVLTAVVSSSAVAGSFLGARLGLGISPDALRRCFAWFVLAMAVFLLAKQLPAPAVAAIREHVVLLFAALAAAVVLALALRRAGSLAVEVGRRETTEILA